MRKLAEREIVVASHNSGKVREINALITPFGFTAMSAAELDLGEPEETGTTFEENSAIKALAAAKSTGLPALADDSGLCVDVLGGAPGVYTANWAEKDDGSGRDFMLAMERVEREIQKTAAATVNRKGRFIAVLCMAWPDGHVEYFRGEVEGVLVWPPRGEAGFGYDPVFLPDGHERTFGEMSAEEKHGWNPDQPDSGLSHRARAFALFAKTCLAGTAP